MRAGASIPDAPQLPQPPRVLSSGFYVPPNGLTIYPYVVLCTNEAFELHPDIPYATIFIDQGRLPSIELTFVQYHDNFLPAVNPAVNVDRPHRLELGDIEVDGTWWTGTREQVLIAYHNYRIAVRGDAGSGAEGGKRHKRSGHKRSGHKRSGKSRRH